MVPQLATAGRNDADAETTCYSILPSIRLENLLPMPMLFQLVNANRMLPVQSSSALTAVDVPSEDVLLMGSLNPADQLDVLFLQWPPNPCRVSLRVALRSPKYLPFGWTMVRVE